MGADEAPEVDEEGDPESVVVKPPRLYSPRAPARVVNIQDAVRSARTDSMHLREVASKDKVSKVLPRFYEASLQPSELADRDEAQILPQRRLRCRPLRLRVRRKVLLDRRRLVVPASDNHAPHRQLLPLRISSDRERAKKTHHFEGTPFFSRAFLTGAQLKRATFGNPNTGSKLDWSHMTVFGSAGRDGVACECGARWRREGGVEPHRSGNHCRTTSPRPLPPPLPLLPPPRPLLSPRPPPLRSIPARPYHSAPQPPAPQTPTPARSGPA